MGSENNEGTVTYTYDPLNRRTKTTFHDNTSTNYTYDAGNRITQVQEKNAGGTVTDTITRTYDGLDRLTQEVTAQGTVNYTYDNASRRATMTVVGQTQVVYTYDNANRLTTITQGTSTVTIGYDDADRRTSVTYPANSVTYAYNAASELTTLTYKQGATTLGDLTYTYDAAGNRIKTGGTFARSNVPPALATTNYNVNNQQMTFGTTTETYDLNGNLATTTDAGVTTTYTWNARNQLTSISKTGLTASFTYDSFGRRTGRTVNGATTNFVYDGLNPVQEKNGATVTANLLTGLGIDEFFTRTDGVGVRSLLPGALGSTIALGDGTGVLQTQYTYEPFGFVSQSGAASTSSYKYTGREDDGTGLAYYRARYYSPRMGRFLSEDPIGMAGGLNFYSYVSNNPLNLIDPLGFQDNSSPWQVGWQWLTGLGPRTHNFTNGDPFTQILIQHQHIQNLIQDVCNGSLPPTGPYPYSLNGLQGVGQYFNDYSTLATAGLTGNLAAAYLGSYNLSYSATKGQLNVQVSNTSSIASAIRPPVIGYTPWWNTNIGDPLTRFFSSGPMSPTTQNFNFSISLAGCGCGR